MKYLDDKINTLVITGSGSNYAYIQHLPMYDSNKQYRFAYKEKYVIFYNTKTRNFYIIKDNQQELYKLGPKKINNIIAQTLLSGRVIK